MLFINISIHEVVQSLTLVDVRTSLDHSMQLINLNCSQREQQNSLNSVLLRFQIYTVLYLVSNYDTSILVQGARGQYIYVCTVHT
jgi:hypothetical protein